MFGKKKEICCICNQNEGAKNLSDGVICKQCIDKCGTFIIALNWKKISSEHVKKAIDFNVENQKRLDCFTASKSIGKYIAVDESNKLVKFPSFSPSLIFTYSEIIDFELLQNGTSITKGGLGSAMIGGAMFGSVGAIVGGTVGKKKNIQEITEYKIKITTKNDFYTTVYINFLITGKTKSDSMIFKGYSNNAQNIMSLLNIIMHNASETPDTSKFNAADEILKYKELLDIGAITQEEFDAKKAQLLNL